MRPSHDLVGHDVAGPAVGDRTLGIPVAVLPGVELVQQNSDVPPRQLATASRNARRISPCTFFRQRHAPWTRHLVGDPVNVGRGGYDNWLGPSQRWKRYEKHRPGHQLQVDVKFIEPPWPEGFAAQKVLPVHRHR
jgi:hypothetical protein